VINLLPNPNTTQFWVAMALGAAGLLIQAAISWGPGIRTAIGNAWESMTTQRTVTVTPPADQDVADLSALKLVQARFVRLNCAEGKAAVTTCFEHFFHGVSA